jgi:hypothetical protein
MFVLLVDYDPLSNFPQGGKVSTPSTLGEGWEGGFILKNRIVASIINLNNSIILILKEYTPEETKKTFSIRSVADCDIKCE